MLTKLCKAVTPFEWKVVQKRCSLLADLNLETPSGPIDLLQGINHPELLVPKEVRRGKNDEPYAIRLSLDG